MPEYLIRIDSQIALCEEGRGMFAPSEWCFCLPRVSLFEAESPFLLVYLELSVVPICCTHLQFRSSTLFDFKASWEKLPVGKEESRQRHGRNRDPRQHLVEVTK